MKWHKDSDQFFFCKGFPCVLRFPQVVGNHVSAQMLIVTDSGYMSWQPFLTKKAPVVLLRGGFQLRVRQVMEPQARTGSKDPVDMICQQRK